ncbi:MAG: DUF2085 domain-containing protein [Deltaproteobacteria bacterium]|nr:DUF2085 domain-containing protein [Deltaproteobacteria bacterium]MBW1872025.1 DUF2085 domain-containing protein [Deltaproteobacteria bacterium]
MPTDLPPVRQGFFGLLLSHHPEDKLHLCYSFKMGRRRVFFCARCLALIPTMFLTLLAGRLSGPWPAWLEWGLLFGPILPAMIDWGTATATGKPERANWVRFTTGLGLGIGAGAFLHINTYALLSKPIMAQFVFLLTTVWMVWLVSYSRRSRQRREGRLKRQKNRPSLEEFMRQAMPEEPDSPTDQRKDGG